jgi:hypothetical protein
LLSAAALCCSGSGGSDGGVVGGPAAFTPSGSSESPGFVRLAGTAVSDARVRVDVEIGGETVNLDLYTFAFDLVLGDPSVASYRTGSASAGNALVADPTNGESGPEAIVFQNGARIVVGVTKLGGDVSPAGNDIPAEGRTILSLELDVAGSGTTILSFGGSMNPPNPYPAPAAIDSYGLVIQSGVLFDDQPAAISR